MNAVKKIIIADDHSYIRLGLIQILKDEYPSAEVKEVPDVETLLKEVVKQDWDLVISDLDMPGRSGLDGLQQIKQLKPLLPVLILSIYSEELYAMRAFKAGASGYLNKNSAPYELIKAIERIRIGRKYITPDVAEKLMDAEDSTLPHQLLTNREFEIFTMLAGGKSTSQIANMLAVAATTVSTHRNAILQKMNLSSNADLTRYALTHHIISDIS